MDECCELGPEIDMVKRVLAVLLQESSFVELRSPSLAIANVIPYMRYVPSIDEMTLHVPVLSLIHI